MRLPIALALVAALAVPVAADCPPDCVAGGGPAATDCFVTWSGIPAGSATCTDGDASCDLDGTVNGVCMLALQACINVAGLPGCTPTGLAGPPTVKPARDRVGQALSAALAALPPAVEGCTPPGLAVPVSVSTRGIKPGKSRLTVTAVSGGKRDRDRVTLLCQPSTTPIGFAQTVAPILAEKCAYSGCHDSFFKAGNQVLESGVAYGDSVGVRASLGKRLRVKPGSISGSEMAHRLLGKGMAPGGTIMPQGCPGLPPDHGCLTDDETFTILTWIATGAQP